MKRLLLILVSALFVGTTVFGQQTLKVNQIILKSTPTQFLKGTNGTIDFNTGDIVLRNTATNVLTLSGGDLLGTGSLGATGTRWLKIWATDLEVTNALTIGGVSLNTLYAPIPTDDILDWSTNKYIPYSSRSAGKFYTGTTNPSSTNRLNFDGYIYATKLFSGGVEVGTGGAGVSDADMRQAINDSITALKAAATDLSTVAMMRHPSVRALTGSGTLETGDDGGIITINSGSANNLTIPLYSSVALPLHSQITIHCLGAGKTTIVATGGVTVISRGDLLGITIKGDAYLINLGTNTWKLVGSLE